MPDVGGPAADGKPMDSNPVPVGFWHPSLQKTRHRVFREWVVTTGFLMAFILAVLSIYWGVFFKIETRLSHLIIYVVDMDGAAPFDNTGNAPFVGPTITQLVEQQLDSGTPTLGWNIRPGSDFNNDVLEVRQAVYNWDAWAAIIINSNASALLYQAVATGNTSYDPLGACQLVYQDSRDDTNWYDFMLPLISQFMTQATSQVGQQWARMALQNASDPTTLANIQAAPQIISPAIGFSEFNLRPFYPYTGIPAVSIGLICRWHRAPVMKQMLTPSSRSDHHLLFQLLVLPPNPYDLHKPPNPPATQVLSNDHLALARYN